MRACFGTKAKMPPRQKAAFRVDASSEIGSGHVMRCLALAEALRQQEVEVHFICAVLPGHLCDLIERSGYDVHRWSIKEEPMQPASHLGKLQEQRDRDSQHTSRVLEGMGRVHWLIVDHYALGGVWEKAVSAHADKVMVIDDLADRQHHCDVLLNQNYSDGRARPYDALVPPQCRRLLGPSYALLRSEFTLARNTLADREGRVKRILLFFGGADATQETEKTLRAFSSIALPGVSLDVVVGASNPRAENIKALCSSMASATYHQQVSTMGTLLSQADLAIGAGGSTTWERCCLGVPSLVVTVAENQESIAQMMADNGYILYLGKSQAVTESQISTALQLVMHNPHLLRSMSRRSMLLVDGKGASRVAKTLVGPNVLMRNATLEDCDKIFGWRNDPGTRKYFFNPGPLSYAEHVEWYRNTLASSDRILLVGQVDQEDIGVVRFDIANGRACMSVYLAPEKRGHGYGQELIRSASQWLFDAQSGVDVIDAEIAEENLASLKAFSEAGYSAFSRKLSLSRRAR